MENTNRLQAEAQFSLVLFEPEIPGNTGTIGRTCVALNLRLILIKPYGFNLDEKSVRRAGLDYWKHVNLTEYDSFDDFIKNEPIQNDNIFFFSRFSSTVHYKAPYKDKCYLVFGAETRGLPKELFTKYPEQFYTLPMNSPHIRSINLANAATAVAFEALRHLSYN
jgi:tRNA (cytidine/uridine-2'-O-)-methyltransferase